MAPESGALVETVVLIVSEPPAGTLAGPAETLSMETFIWVGVLVAGTGVFDGGTGVFVAGAGVLVAAAGVLVGLGVFVAGIGVLSPCGPSSWASRLGWATPARRWTPRGRCSRAPADSPDWRWPR